MNEEIKHGEECSIVLQTPLCLTYAQIEMILQSEDKPEVLTFDFIRTKLGWFKTAEALHEKAILIKHYDKKRYVFSFFGRRLAQFVWKNKTATKGALIAAIRKGDWQK